MSAPDAELAYRVLDLTKAHPEHLNMAQWASRELALADLTDLAASCGTTACFAGWTVAVAGYVVNSEGDVYSPASHTYVDNVEYVAADLLGITMEQADALFFVEDDEIDEAVAEIFGPRPAQSYGTGCRCDWLGEGTPEHAPSPLCRSLRPDADRDGGAQ